MFSQYGSNLTEDGDVFKTLGAIVAAVQADVSVGAPEPSVISEVTASPTANADFTSGCSAAPADGGDRKSVV